MTVANDKVEIRCTRDVHKGWKKITADFDNGEHALMWLIENYEHFKSIRPPEMVASRKMKLERGVL